MDKHICKAKTVYDGSYVSGYYVAVPWEHTDEVIHLIIDVNAEYQGGGSFSWHNVHRVDPNTICASNNT
jgi:hypothetical protein